MIRNLFETWNEGDREAGLRVSHEDSVLHRRVRAHGRASGLELDQPIGWLIEFRGEKLAETWFCMGHDEALRAAGLA